MTPLVAGQEQHNKFASCAQARLEEAFGALPVWLAAENGIFIRPPGGAWITLLQARFAVLSATCAVCDAGSCVLLLLFFQRT